MEELQTLRESFVIYRRGSLSAASPPPLLKDKAGSSTSSGSVPLSAGPAGLSSATASSAQSNTLSVSVLAADSSPLVLSLIHI